VSGQRDWFVEAFGEDYRTVYPHRDLASARREMAWVLEQGIGGRILDLCCGFGRHSLALLDAGADVFGVDLSPQLLAQAATLPGGERLRGRLARADARVLPFRDACFDAVVVLFSSFGYFGDEGDRRVLAETARVLRPGGDLLLDLMNPEQVRASLVPRSRRRIGESTLTEIRTLGGGGRRVTKEVVLRAPDGTTRTWREEVRMYEAREVEGLAAAVGLALERVHGSFEGAPAGPGAPRQILRLRRV